MARQVESQNGEAMAGEPFGQGPPPIEVPPLTMNEHRPTIPVTRALASQREGARTGKLDGNHRRAMHLCRVDSHDTYPIAWKSLATTNLGVTDHCPGFGLC